MANLPLMCERCERELRIGERHGRFFCPLEPVRGGGGIGLGIVHIHPSERAVIYENPQTGEVRYPMRADRVGQVEQLYLATGYQRRTLDSGNDVRQFEKRRGVRHERSNFGPHGDESPPC